MDQINLQEILNVAHQMLVNVNKRMVMDWFDDLATLSTFHVHPQLVGGDLDRFQSTSNHMI
jgi:hypothetical protein